jgi:hypothetical protein
MSVLLFMILALVLPVAAQTPQPIGIGETVEIKADQLSPQLALSVSEPAIVTLIARGGDQDSDPYLSLVNAAGRELAYASDNMGGRADLAPYDAVIENYYLLPGDYNLSVSGIYGDQVAKVTMEAGDPGLIGLGKTSVISGTVVERGRFRYTLPWNENQIVTVSVMAQADTLNPRMEIRDSQGVPVAISEDRDYERGDAVLNYYDPQVKYFVVPKTDTYDIEINSYSDTEQGDIRLFITDYGTLSPREGPGIENFKGDLVPNGRLNFSSIMKRGEVVTITAKATAEGIDPFLSLLNVQGVPIAENDDHNTTNPDLQYADAQLRNLIIEEAGKYTVEITAQSGSGPIEVTVEHLGTFESVGQ